MRKASATWLPRKEALGRVREGVRCGVLRPHVTPPRSAVLAALEARGPAERERGVLTITIRAPEREEVFDPERRVERRVLGVVKGMNGA